MLELISSRFCHRGPSPPPHALIGGNPLIKGTVGTTASAYIMYM
jgi:hypothetical protein